MKSVLLISDVSKTKYLVRDAMRSIRDAALIGVARSFLNAEEKAITLEPDFILVEQRSLQMDGIMLAAAFEAAGLISDVIILHEDDMAEKNVYSNNVRGFLRYSDIDRHHLEALFRSSQGEEDNGLSKKIRNGYDLPFQRFSLFVVSWPESVRGECCQQGRRRLIEICSDIKHYMNPGEGNTCAVFLETLTDEKREELLPELAHFLREENTHGFFFQKLTQNYPVEKIIDAYTFKEDISPFFDESEYLSVIDQIVFPPQISESEISKLISLLELALTEADLQEANQLCIHLFNHMVKQSLSMNIYRSAVNKFNKCIARKKETPREKCLSTLRTVASTENQALNFIKDSMKSAGMDYSSRIYDAINYMRRNYREKISLQDIAEYTYTNPAYLSQLFSREVGYTITNYLKNIRIRRACIFLKQQKSVKEAAALCGFDDVKYFTRQFKQTMLITPSEYRKQNAEKEVK